MYVKFLNCNLDIKAFRQKTLYLNKSFHRVAFCWVFNLNILIVLSQYGWAAPTQSGWLTNCPSAKGVVIELIDFILLFNQPIIFLLQGAVFIQGLQVTDRRRGEGVGRRKGTDDKRQNTSHVLDLEVQQSAKGRQKRRHCCSSLKPQGKGQYRKHTDSLIHLTTKAASDNEEKVVIRLWLNPLSAARGQLVCPGSAAASARIIINIKRDRKCDYRSMFGQLQ